MPGPQNHSKPSFVLVQPPDPPARQLHYAEESRNPPPQALHIPPESHSRLQASSHGAASSSASIFTNRASGAPTMNSMADDDRGLDSDDIRSQGTGRFAPPKRILPTVDDPEDMPWWRNIFTDHWKSWLVAVCGVGAILTIVLVAVGCTGGFGSGRAVRGSDALPANFTSSVSSESLASTTTSDTPAATKTGLSSSAATSTGTAAPPPQCNTHTFVNNVTFTAIWAATSGWTFKILSAADAPSCCGLCYNSTGTLPSGTSCNAWQWDSGNTAAVACTVLLDFKGGVQEDGKCPSGYTELSFATGSGGKFVGGSGPCGGPAHLNGAATATNVGGAAPTIAMMV